MIVASAVPSIVAGPQIWHLEQAFCLIFYYRGEDPSSDSTSGLPARFAYTADCLTTIDVRFADTEAYAETSRTDGAIGGSTLIAGPP